MTGKVEVFDIIAGEAVEGRGHGDLQNFSGITITLSVLCLLTSSE